MSKYNFSVHKYMNDRLAIQAYDAEGPFAKLSVNVEEVELAPDEFILNHDLLHPSLIDFRLNLLALDAFEETGRTCSYGFCKNIPIWRVDVSKL